MRILVTGGAGFIGSHTVDAIVASGAGEVSVLDNFSTGKRHQVNPKATLYETDLRDAAAVASVVEKARPEIIFHLAAQMDVRRSVADPVFERTRPYQPLAGEPPSPANPPPGCPFHRRCPRVQDRCRSELPPLTEIAPGRAVACHYPH